MQFIIDPNSQLPSSMRLNLLLPGYHNSVMCAAADTFTTGGSNSAKDQAKENGSLARRTSSEFEEQR